jgi:hypothetical protein
MAHKHEYTFIWGIRPKTTFVSFAVFGKIITKPKRIEPKLKNFTAVVPVLVESIQVVKKTQLEKIEKVNRIMLIITNMYLNVIEAKRNIVNEIIENENII